MSYRLAFYDEGHRYELNGEEIPSVSEILRFLSREVYGEIDRYLLDHAAERGTAVHEATQELDRTGSCEIELPYQGYLEAYARFLRDHRVEWTLTEKPMADPIRKYAGTLDRAGYLDGYFSIVDLKTNQAVKKSLVKAQLNAYYLLAMANHIGPVDRLWCLQLCENGRYRLYNVKIDETEFRASLELHKALKKKHGRMRIE